MQAPWEGLLVAAKAPASQPVVAEIECATTEARRQRARRLTRAVKAEVVRAPAGGLVGSGSNP